MIINPYIQFLFASIILVLGSELLISNSKSIAEKFNISKFVIGITILAFGTSLPELVVSISAMFNIPPQGDVVIGNVIGSNIANISLVLAAIAIIKPIKLNMNNKLYFNLLAMFFITLLFILFIRYHNIGLVKLEGCILLISLFLYLYILFSRFSRETIDENKTKRSQYFFTFILLVIGFVLLKYGSDLFVSSSLIIAQKLGFKTIAISMTLVALGTSLPELITSLVAVYKDEKALALGNIVGSNIINISLVASVSSIISDIDINYLSINNHILILFLLTTSIIIFSVIFKKIGRIIGVIYLSIYLYFIMINFIKMPLL